MYEFGAHATTLTNNNQTSFGKFAKDWRTLRTLKEVYTPARWKVENSGKMYPRSDFFAFRRMKFWTWVRIFETAGVENPFRACVFFPVIFDVKQYHVHLRRSIWICLYINLHGWRNMCCDMIFASMKMRSVLAWLFCIFFSFNAFFEVKNLKCSNILM